tara:strand:+ start:4567 stop:5919 length:1353 start_codon:yes stop_codon:yes gene_type:complete
MPKKTNIEEPEESLVTAKTRSPWELFHYKKAYKEKDSVFEDGPGLLDSRDERQLYGKINLKRELIYPSEEFLLTINSVSEQPIYAINFVASAFRGFRKYMRRAALRKRVNVDFSKIFTLEPVRGYENVRENFHSYLNSIYLSFYNFYIQRDNKNKNIKDFDSFLEIFLPYIKNFIKQFDVCFTLSGFISNQACTPMISGMMIDTYDGDCNDDTDKRKLFLENPNFEFYRRTAKKFGFVIDKDIPWRLVADLSSNAMKREMHKRGVEYKNMFDEYYYTSYKYDVDSLKKYLLGFYNSIVKASPFVASPEYCAEKGKTISKVIKRTEMSIKMLDEKYSLEDWLKIYVDIRMHETKSKLLENDVHLLFRDIKRMIRKVDIFRTMSYINRKIETHSRNNAETFKQPYWKNFDMVPKGFTVIAKNSEAAAAIATAGLFAAGLDLTVDETEDSEDD